jgi:peptidoglycan hydrolase-like protein with peptidoglycan-binding domain
VTERALPRRRLLLPVVVASILVLATTADAVALPASYPTTSLGNRGANVRALQHLLREHGSMNRVDGLFAESTRQAVIAFQTDRGLPANGIVASPTWTALCVTRRPGDTGEAVLGLQRLLNEKRHAGLPLDGVYGDAMRSAVRAFQRHAGLTVTGVASPTTWRALLAHLELPAWGDRLCDYSVGNGKANWGTAAAIGQLQAAADIVVAKGHGRVALGDIGFEHGGDIPGHVTHEQGLDVDVRLMRKARNQCRWGGNWRASSYDRAATRDLIRAIRATAPGHVKLIYFNDPVLIREGLVRARSGHDDHLHVRYCEAVHPVAAYDC